MSDAFLGEIRLFAGNYEPKDWAFCDGRYLAISQNTALYSILGNTYGGDGRTTFALPDLRGRVPLGEGAGAGLTNRSLGEKGGSESHTLSVSELPSHDHAGAAGTLNVVSGAGNDPSPTGNYLAAQAPPNFPYHSGPTNATLAADAVSASSASTGDDQPHNNMPPFTTMNYIICIRGLFPTRSF